MKFPAIVLRSLAVALVLALAAAPVHGWNVAGHMVNGALAYSILKQESPGTIPKVIAILKQHPDYESRWEKQINAPFVGDDERDLYLFMLAARWPDDIRRGSKLNRPRWHYINFPFVPADQPESVTPVPPDPDNILRAFATNLAVLGGDAEDADKAIALCWVFHLVGDVHQPLHSTSRFTTDFPEGDKGATKLFVRGREENRPVNLHKIWDDLILGSSRFQEVRNRATALRFRDDFKRDQLTELANGSFESWAKESFCLAKEAVYLDGKLEGSASAEDAPVLPEGYTKKAKAIGERRIMLAGYRLADMLRKALP